MDLLHYINDAFPDGLTYDETAQLCLRLYCSVDGLPEQLKEQCNKSNLCVVFAELSAAGFIKGITVGSVIYGANFHEVFEKGHWVEVIASIFKNGNTVDAVKGDNLSKSLTLRSRGTPQKRGAP